MLENGLKTCICPKIKCPRHGKCRECAAYHQEKNNLPRCRREKKSILKKLFEVPRDDVGIAPYNTPQMRHESTGGQTPPLHTNIITAAPSRTRRRPQAF